MATTDLTFDRLRELLIYEPETGLFKWRVRRANLYKPGDIAGGLCKKGYVRILVDNNKQRANRLAWFYMTGEWPQLIVDHINRVRHDNRWENLRLATHSENQQNSDGPRRGNSSGYRGVSMNYKGWKACITKDGVHHYLGTFHTPELAYSAYQAARARLHRFHPRDASQDNHS